MLGPSEKVDTFTEDSFSNNLFLVRERYVEDDGKVDDSCEGPGGRMVADGCFAAAPGSDPGSGIRHRMHSDVRDSDRLVRSDRDGVRVERTGYPGS